MQYLVGDDAWGARGGTLYLVARDFTESGSYGKRSGLGSALEDRVAALSLFVEEVRRDGLPKVFVFAMALLAGVLTLVFILPLTMRRYRRSRPRFTEPLEPLAQGGLAGRAALLGSPATHPALSVLELKSALEEILRDRLGIAALASQEEILKEIDRQDALSRRNSGLLKGLFEQMSRTESAVVRTEPIRLPEAKIRRMHADAQVVLSDLGTRIRKHP